MKKSRLTKAAVTVYCTLLIVFVLLMVYMGLFERNEIYSSRAFCTSCTIQPAQEQILSDASAPAGIRREFTWTMPDTDTTENCLAFYLVHHYAQVWFDDELVYSLTPAENNRIGNSPSSEWVILPLCPSDSGRAVTVILTPAYKSVTNRTVAFRIGSLHTIVMNQLQSDLPQIILSGLCVLVGLSLMFTQFFLARQKKASDWELFYIGIFTLLIGIWRITDTRSSPFLFPQNTMVLGYITIGALFLVVTPLALYMRTHYRDSEKPLLIVALMGCISTAIALICQIFGLADLREMLTLSHIMLIIMLVVLLWVCLLHVRRGTDHGKFWRYIVLLGVGFLMDLACFYIRGSSSGIVFTVLALLVFSLSRFAASILSANRKAYTDSRTGLFNKNRWDELMRQPRMETDTIGIIMMDLNRLKYINDTMGHEAGDKMIQNFANILRNTIPATNTICRWGGDEFTVMITNASREKMEQYTAAVAAAAAHYNATGGTPQIHYATGWVLSSEFPEMTPEELLREADRRMYLDKQRWYSVN